MIHELLRAGADAAPDQPLVLSLERSLSYADCLARAEGLAAGLQERSLDRFACYFDDVGELTALLCASSLAGSEACSYPPVLDEAGVDRNTVSFGHGCVVSDRQLSLESAETITSDELASTPQELPPPADDPLLVLTTGTTGEPKGVRHSWSRLIGGTHPDKETGNRWLLAYNLNQFAGLQVLLHVLVSRGTIVVPPSRQPPDVLEALRKLEVTHVSGTPTFWRLLTLLLDEEIASELKLRQITLGGEAVPESLLERMRRLFPDIRISQVYASSEFGSVVSVTDGHAGLPLSVLDRGEDASVELKVIDGELHARSRVGMLGYLGQDDSEGWRPTGDLVEVRGDRLHFVGRSTETINVGGVKVHPLPIEDLVGGVEGVRLAHAYGRSNPVTGELVALDVVAEPGVDTEALEEEIRAVCQALQPASQPRRIKFVSDVEVREHKIARSSP